MIVATDVYALLLKFLQKNSQHNVQTNGGGGSKAFLTMLKKTALFLQDGFPNPSESPPVCFAALTVSGIKMQPGQWILKEVC